MPAWHLHPKSYIETVWRTSHDEERGALTNTSSSRSDRNTCKHSEGEHGDNEKPQYCEELTAGKGEKDKSKTTTSKLEPESNSAGKVTDNIKHRQVKAAAKVATRARKAGDLFFLLNL